MMETGSLFAHILGDNTISALTANKSEIE